MATISGLPEYKPAICWLAIKTIAAKASDMSAVSFIPSKTTRLACSGLSAPSQKATRALQAIASLMLGFLELRAGVIVLLGVTVVWGFSVWWYGEVNFLATPGVSLKQGLRRA